MAPSNLASTQRPLSVKPLKTALLDKVISVKLVIPRIRHHIVAPSDPETAWDARCRQPPVYRSLCLGSRLSIAHLVSVNLSILPVRYPHRRAIRPYPVRRRISRRAQGVEVFGNIPALVGHLIRINLTGLDDLLPTWSCHQTKVLQNWYFRLFLVYRSLWRHRGFYRSSCMHKSCRLYSPKSHGDTIGPNATKSSIFGSDRSIKILGGIAALIGQGCKHINEYLPSPSPTSSCHRTIGYLMQCFRRPPKC